MKVLGVLGGLVMLFGLTHVRANVRVICTMTRLIVEMRRLPLVDDLPVQPHELTLGDDCPVSTVHSQYLIFNYVVSLCGMRIYEQQSGLLIETSITYNSPQLDFYVHLPIACFVPRNSLISTIMKRGRVPSREYMIVQNTWPALGASEYMEMNLRMLSWTTCPLLGYGNFTASKYIEGGI
ncbi:oocyte-secreted protein 4A-like isoform X2 [Cavia porcellus]|uniref:oocyte-secreted protein 4A-like isoform X2 n=1 Tax=Cavia porcellus TaxID=10141 RepID=UPI002FE059C6